MIIHAFVSKTVLIALFVPPKKSSCLIRRSGYDWLLQKLIMKILVLPLLGGPLMTQSFCFRSKSDFN